MLLYRDFRGFDGCLKGVLGDVWSDKNKNDASYGTRPNKVPWTDREDMMVRNYVLSHDFDCANDIHLVLNYALGRYAFFVVVKNIIC